MNKHNMTLRIENDILQSRIVESMRKLGENQFPLVFKLNKFFFNKNKVSK